MASEADRKKVDNLPVWQQIKNSFRGGYDNEAAQQAYVKSQEMTNQNALSDALKKRTGK